MNPAIRVIPLTYSQYGDPATLEETLCEFFHGLGEGLPFP